MFFVIPTEERVVGPLEELLLLFFVKLSFDFMLFSTKIFEEEDNVGSPELEATLRIGNGHAEIVEEIIGWWDPDNCPFDNAFVFNKFFGSFSSCIVRFSFSTDTPTVVSYLRMKKFVQITVKYTTRN